MKEILWSATLLLLLIGCSSKKEEMHLDQVYKQNFHDYKNLQKTEKVQLYDGNDTKALLTATYLYRQITDIGDAEDEKFIVGIYLEEESDLGHIWDECNLTLNGIHPKELHHMAKQSKALEGISFVTDWGSEYLVTFPHQAGKSFDLIFTSKKYGKAKMHFAKVAKYELHPKKH